MADEKGVKAKRPSTFVIVLATIGGLALLNFLFFAGIIVTLLFKSGKANVPLVSSGEKIGILKLEGVITSPDAFLKDLRDFRKDESIKAIIVRIDSPGGAVGASQEIFRALRQADNVKPVVASLVNTAASGAFYAACGTRYIVSDAGTVTGSIGVIMKLPNIGGLLEKLGIKTTVIKSGRLKDLASITRDLTDEEREVLKAVMDDVHDQFIRDVASGRKLSYESVKEIADGRIFSGKQALKLGLIDEIGNFNTAIKKAAEFAKIKGEPVLCYPEKDKITAIKEILEDSGARTMLRFLNIFFQSPLNTQPQSKL